MTDAEDPSASALTSAAVAELRELAERAKDDDDTRRESTRRLAALRAAWRHDPELFDAETIQALRDISRLLEQSRAGSDAQQLSLVLSRAATSHADPIRSLERARAVLSGVFGYDS